jgi:hypothetical protein
MDLDLEKRWQAAVEAKQSGRVEPGSPPKGMELLWKVTDPDYVGTAAENWSSWCEASIRKEKIEVEKKYGIRFGRTEIYCARCGRPWGFGRHTCRDIVFNQLQEEKSKNREVLESQKESLLGRMQNVGAKKISTLSYDDEKKIFIREKLIRQWIYRRSIPLRRVEQIEDILKCVSL